MYIDIAFAIWLQRQFALWGKRKANLAVSRIVNTTNNIFHRRNSGLV